MIQGAPKWLRHFRDNAYSQIKIMPPFWNKGCVLTDSAIGAGQAYSFVVRRSNTYEILGFFLLFFNSKLLIILYIKERKVLHNRTRQ